MEFWLTIIGLVRRKQVFVPVLLTAATFGLLAFAFTPASYVSRSTMVLTLTQFGGSESRDPSTPTDLTNPMLNFNDSLITTSAILINTMNAKDVTKQLGARGSTELIVDDGRSDPDLLGLNGPFLHITVSSTSPANASRIVDEAQALMQLKLEEWQARLQAPKATYIRIVEVVAPNTPQVDRGQPMKYGILAGALGGALALAIAYLRHRLRGRRPAPPALDLTSPREKPRHEKPPHEKPPHERPPREDSPRDDSLRERSERVLVPDAGEPEPATARIPQVPVKKNSGPRRR